jgi:hypothetical protein
MAKALDRADRDDLAELYEALGLAVAYDHPLQVAEVSITPALRGVKLRVRGGDTHLNHTLGAQWRCRYSNPVTADSGGRLRNDPQQRSYCCSDLDV